LEAYESKNIFPILTSNDPNCFEWFEKYGEDKVKKWMNEVDRYSAVGNFVFQQVARYLFESEKKGRRKKGSMLTRGLLLIH